MIRGEQNRSAWTSEPTVDCTCKYYVCKDYECSCLFCNDLGHHAGHEEDCKFGFDVDCSCEEIRNLAEDVDLEIRMGRRHETKD